MVDYASSEHGKSDFVRRIWSWEKLTVPTLFHEHLHHQSMSVESYWFLPEVDYQ